MGQVVFLNTNYKPREAEKMQFHFLQTATNNFVNDIYKEEKDETWAKYRISLMVQSRRSKMKLVEDDNEE